MVPDEGLAWRHSNDFDSATLYLFLIDATNFIGFAPGDTMASHAGWQELTTYSQGARVTWAHTGAGKFMTNTPGATFTASATGEAVGWGLTTVSTKGGTTGTILALRLFEGGGLTRVASEPWVVIHNEEYVSGD